ncbi:unnamed protein product [Mytilus edulis]|uniref:B box-type domain-containing protein n=1 Tax=Mytilus edulis TaxID=6550 RepID=A0A8S3VEG6_MYTED|nr:unnamed protein product [Mytilus edulis]
MLCQLCEESNKIKWKCLQCDFLLCTKCQKIHNKVKSTDQHTIIDIKDIASQKQEAKVNTDFSALKRKKQQENIAENRSILMLKDCIREQYEAKVIEQYQTGLNLVEQLVCSDDGTLWIGNIADKILQKTQLSNGKLNIVQEVKSLTHALASVHTTDVFGALNKEKIARKQSNEPTNTYIKRLPQFVPGTVDIPEELHGKLTESEIDYAQENYLFKVMTKYKTELKLVEMIVFCNDTLWISNFTIKSIQKIQFVNGLVNVVQEVQIHLVGMALLKSGDLLYIYWRNNS